MLGGLGIRVLDCPESNALENLGLSYIGDYLGFWVQGLCQALNHELGGMLLMLLITGDAPAHASLAHIDNIFQV